MIEEDNSIDVSLLECAGLDPALARHRAAEMAQPAPPNQGANNQSLADKMTPEQLRKKHNDQGFKTRDQSVEEFLETQSDFYKVRSQVAKLRSDVIGTHTPGTAEFATRRSQFSRQAVDMVTKVFLESERVPDFCLQGRKWYQGLPDANKQYVDAQTSDLDAFGNMMLHHINRIHTLYGFGRAAGTAVMLGVSYATAYSMKSSLLLNPVLTGQSSAGKSYQLEKMGALMPPGVFRVATYETARSSCVSGCFDGRVVCHDEFPAWFVGNSKESVGSDTEAILKSKLTRGQVTTTAPFIDPQTGARSQLEIVSTHCSVTCGAIDGRRPPPSALSARFVFVPFYQLDASEPDSTIKRMMQPSYAVEMAPLAARLVQIEQLIGFSCAVVESCIFAGALEEPSMDAFAPYFQLFQDAMTARGRMLTNPKDMERVKLVARTLTVRYAVVMGLFSPHTKSRRVDQNGAACFDLLRHPHVLLPLIEAHLVCTRAIVIYAISLCQMFWGNPVMSFLMPALRAFAIPREAHAAFDENLIPMPASQTGKRRNADLDEERLVLVDVERPAPVRSQARGLLANLDPDFEPEENPGAVVPKTAPATALSLIRFEQRVFDSINKAEYGSDYNYIELRLDDQDLMVEPLLKQLWRLCTSPRPSVDNLRHALYELADTQLVLPKLIKGPNERICKSGDETHTINVVRIVRNTNKYDVRSMDGKGMRVFVSVAALLMAESLEEHVLESFAELGFNHSRPGRFLTSVPNRVLYGHDGDYAHQVSAHAVFSTVRIVRNASKTLALSRIDPLTNQLLDSFAQCSDDPQSILRTFVPPADMRRSTATVTDEPEDTAFVSHAARIGINNSGDYAPKNVEAMRAAVRDPKAQSYAYPRAAAEDAVRNELDRLGRSERLLEHSRVTRRRLHDDDDDNNNNDNSPR